jgi:ketosteroid isomerase-like protein
MPADANDNAALIDSLYEAFARQDGDAMAACYTPDAHFADPVFTHLHGEEVGAMWRMLCERATDLRVEHSQVKAEGDEGSAHWEAHYTFSSGRPVHNVIEATFQFRDGKIADHRDWFDLYAWARQALGPLGFVLGWTPPLHRRIQAQARQSLEEFMAGPAPAAGD